MNGKEQRRLIWAPRAGEEIGRMQGGRAEGRRGWRGREKGEGAPAWMMGGGITAALRLRQVDGGAPRSQRPVNASSLHCLRRIRR